MTIPHEISQSAELKEDESLDEHFHSPSSLLHSSHPEKMRPAYSKLRYRVRKAVDILSMDMTQAYRSASRNVPQYLLGCGSVFVVVFISSILLTAISYAPVVFLALAETTAGQLDLRVSPSSFSNYNHLNYSALRHQLPDESQYSFPRIIKTSSSTYSLETCDGYDPSEPRDVGYLYDGTTVQSVLGQALCESGGVASCIDFLCSQTSFASLYFIDTKLESELGIVRDWPYDSDFQIPPGKCLIHKSLARTLRVDVDDYIAVPLSLSQVFPQFLRESLAQDEDDSVGVASELHGNSVVVVLQIAGLIPEGNYGKLPLEEDASILVELETGPQLLVDSLHPAAYNSSFFNNYTRVVTQALLDRPDSYYDSVSRVIFLCAKHRRECYMDSDYSVVSRRLTRWSSDLIFQMDYRRVSSDMPVLRELSASQVISAFLTLIFNIVVLMMGGLSAFLIYSLLMVSVDTRTFEMGVFRMIGLSKSGLVFMILVQAMLYAVPGWAFGLAIGQLIWLLTRPLFQALLNAEVGSLLSRNSIWFSTLLGIVVPLVASIFPIRNALTKNLHDALDVRRSKTKAVVFSVVRSGNQVFSPALLLTGSILAVLGFLIYYLLPLSLLYNNITLLFNIFLVLLVGMMLGLVLLSLNLQPIIERAFVFILFRSIFFWEKTSMPKLITKNLVAHRLRNSKTSIMYATALGFIIFLTVAIRIELRSLIFQEQRAFGGDIVVEMSPDFRIGEGPAGLLHIAEFEEYCIESPHIDGFTYSTYDTSLVNVNISATEISNIGRTNTFSSSLVGIAPNFYDVPDPDFSIVAAKRQNLNSAYSMSEQLYLREPMYAHTGARFISDLDLDFKNSFLVNLQQENRPFVINDYVEFQPAGYMISGPRFRFSEFPTVNNQHVVTSYLSYLRALNGAIPGLSRIPIERMYLRLKPTATDSDRDEVMIGLSRIATLETIIDGNVELAGFISAQSTLDIIFLIVTIAAMVVAFFSLNSSMVTNIFEQQMEIGILMALGLKKWEILRLFTYEAFILVLSASMLGTMIGIVAGWSMAAQRSVVTEVPLVFLFPFDIFTVVVVASLLCAVLATVLPVMRLVGSTSIIQLIRG